MRTYGKRADVLEYIRKQHAENPAFEIITVELNKHFGFDCSTVVSFFIKAKVLKMKCGCRTGTNKGSIYVVTSAHNLAEPKKVKRINHRNTVKVILSSLDSIIFSWRHHVG